MYAKISKLGIFISVDDRTYTPRHGLIIHDFITS